MDREKAEGVFFRGFFFLGAAQKFEKQIVFKLETNTLTGMTKILKDR